MKFRNKFLIYLLTVMMALPTWLVTGIINAPHALAAPDPILASGPKGGSTFAGDIAGAGSINWSNPNRVAISNSSWSTVSLTANQVSSYLEASNFGFSIPATATVTGILAGVERHSDETPAHEQRISDKSIRLVKGGAISGDDKARNDLWPSSDAVAAYGSNSDLWGLSLTPTDVNSSNFGVVLAAQHDSDSHSRTASVDYISLTVYYKTDGTAPIIAAHADVVAEATSATGTNVDYTSPTASDNVDADAPAVCTPISGSFFSIGTTQITCTKTDAAGNIATPTHFNVIVKDTTGPVVSNITSSAGTTGEIATVTAQANDAVSGIKNVAVSVNGGAYAAMTSSVSGIYTYDIAIPSTSVMPVTYTIQATDNADNITTSPVQTIVVTDNDSPAITSVNSAPDTTGDVTTITAVATDNIGIVKAEIDFNNAGFVPMVTGVDKDTYQYFYRLSEVDPATLSYVIRFTDAAGNTTISDNGVITPIDDIKPVITLNGAAAVTIEKGSVYADAGATATDNFDGNLTNKIVVNNAVDATKVGTYLVTYDVVDAAGNVADQVVRIVNVIDTVPPVVTFNNVVTNSTSPMLSGKIDDNTALVFVLVNGKIYKATNNQDGTWKLEAGLIDPLKEGEYTVTIQALDDSSNITKIDGKLTIDLTAGVPQVSSSVSDKTITLTWTDSAADTLYYEVYAGLDFSNLVLSATNIKAKTYSLSVLDYGTYAIKVVAVDASGNKSIDTNNVNKINVSVVAPVSAASSDSTSSDTATTPATSKAVTNPQTQPQAQTQAPSDANGIIKGDQTKSDEADKINWTPWIILFVLILLAGAITGGYFYWFNGDDDDKEPTVVTSIKKPTPAPKPVTQAKKSNKKQKRW